MLVLKVPETELYDSSKNLFITYKESSLTLEHSLMSISKWESKWHKPYFSSEKKTPAEIKDYIRCMTISQIPDEYIYDRLSSENINQINDYILDPMTATTFKDEKKRKSREIITSEVIYYLMVTYGIPFECQKWHINKLFTLIKVCEIKNSPPKKMSKNDVLKQYKELNAYRRSVLNSKG